MEHLNVTLNKMREKLKNDRDLGQVERITPSPYEVSVKDLENRGIYKRYQNITFKSIVDRGIPNHLKSQYKVCADYARNLGEQLKQGDGLILSGGVGTLKTTLAIAILRYQLEKSEGRGGLFIPMPSLLDQLFTLKARSLDEWLSFEERLKKTPLLIIDDLGAEYHQEWVMSKVDAIITERYNRCRSVIITTNLTAGEIKGKYAERITDRLRSVNQWVSFDGSSLRKAD